MFFKVSTNSWSSLAYFFSILSICYGGIHLFDTSYPAILPSTVSGLLLAIISFAGLAISHRRGEKWNGVNLNLLLFLLLVLILSDITTRAHNPIQHSIHPALFALIATFTGAVLHFSGTWGIFLICCATYGLALIGFSDASNGRLLFSDDHPSFLYRLIQLRDNFPNIPFYNPFWNGGVEAREFFPSGILNVFFLFLPLVYIGDLICNYNTIIFTLIFVIGPTASYLTARISSLNKTASLIASLLSLSTSLFWYKWALTYGTIGFITSIIFMPMAIASTIQLIDNERALIKDFILFLISISLTLLWPLSVVALTPLFIYIVFQFRKILSKPKVIFSFALLGLIHLPWMVVFSKASNVVNFVSTPKIENVKIAETDRKNEDSAQVTKIFKSAIALIREHSEAINPLLLLSICGFGLIKSRSLSRILKVHAIWFLLLAVIVRSFKPHMELDRFILAFCHILIIPTSCILASFKSEFGSIQKRIYCYKFWLTSFALGLIIITPLQVYSVTSNRSVLRYHFADKIVVELVSAINSQPISGRVLFAGFILHELSEGHVALLAALVNKPLIASSYQHNLWKYQDIIPEEFRLKGEKGINEYLNIMNVRYIITHDPNWRRYFTKRKRRFKLKWRQDRFSIFEDVTHSENYFLKGSGQVISQNDDSIEIHLNQPDAILKFNFYSFLETNSCHIKPYSEFPPLNLISLESCNTKQKIVIKGQSFGKRLIAW